jgi:hypothetical protein
MGHRRIVLLLAVTAWAVAAVPGTPIAGAKPSNGTLQRECHDAGGTWSSYPDGHGGSQSSCEYRDGDGHKHIDYYKNGSYVGTDDVGR